MNDIIFCILYVVISAISLLNRPLKIVTENTRNQTIKFFLCFSIWNILALKLSREEARWFSSLCAWVIYKSLVQVDLENSKGTALLDGRI